jgi:methionyl-tRNA formyltransferase
VVVTQPARPAGRGQKLTSTPVAQRAEALGLEVRTPTALRAFVAELATASPDRCVVASYGRIVPQVVLDVVPLWFNVHPSLLPLYRGATPIQTAIRDGRTATAVSIIAMDAGMDTGDLVAQTGAIAIEPDDTYGTLHDRLAAIGADLLASVLEADAAGTLVRTPQPVRQRELGIPDDEVVATTTRPWTKDDRVLQPFARRHRSQDVIALLRALRPTPGALVEFDGERLGVIAAHVAYDATVAVRAGDVIADGEWLALGTIDGAVVIDELLPPGKKPMTTTAWLNGRRR